MASSRFRLKVGGHWGATEVFETRWQHWILCLSRITRAAEQKERQEEGLGVPRRLCPQFPSRVDVAQPRAALGNGREGPAAPPGLKVVKSTLPTPPWTGQAPGSLGSSGIHCLTSCLAGGPASTFKAPGRASQLLARALATRWFDLTAHNQSLVFAE